VVGIPVCLAVIFVIAYMFVKSFPDANGNYPPSPLIRIAVISLGSIVGNATVLLTLFVVALVLDPVFQKFGSTISFLLMFWLLSEFWVSWLVQSVLCAIFLISHSFGSLGHPMLFSA
jgi:hypothetical protein